MSGLDDVIGGLAKQGGSGGLQDLLGGLLGGKRAGGAGAGLDDLLGGLTGSTQAGRAGRGGVGMGALAGALAPLLIQLLRSGGLSKLVQDLRGKGLGGKADSWVAAGENEPVSGSEMRVALGDDEVHRFAREAGLPDDEAAEVLAAVVPRVVDGLTPAGKVPDEEELAALVRRHTG